LPITEYKREFPKRGLAKQFASFSNTRGGLIIIGPATIERKILRLGNFDPVILSSGVPISCNGVINDNKLLDQIHQYATLIQPIPAYQACITDEKNGRVFALIRIFEGDNTPYFIHNDSNIWIRTGNISNPIDHASPDALELLYMKREKAEKLRNIQLDRKSEIVNAAIARQEKQRVLAISSTDETEQSHINQNEVGSNISLCEISFQPFYPKKSLINPFEIKNSLSTLRSRFHNSEFPNISRLETMPYGVLSFYWSNVTGSLQIDQVFGSGLISNSRDISRIDENGNKSILLTLAAIFIYSTLLFGVKYYSYIGYHGNIVGYIKLVKTKGAAILPILPEGWHYNFYTHTGLLDEYVWDITTDTAEISDDNRLRRMFQEILDGIYMSFDYSPPGEKLFNAFLK
jgi:hypothetical protein